ncbi:alkyl sulfatase C-terminal domain-containing protein [Streptomyces sp. NPDC086989]|uniref:alkyl sulfatase C-terminal domain-containing protein n=1 Tax=Streptomyces sp. NPDC086989 TaxID=3365764 RepID=UPI00380130ED
MRASSGDAEAVVAEANGAARRRPAFDDTRDLEDERRGFLGTAEEAAIRDADGRVVWDLDAYGFLDADCAPTAHPSLWRQSRLVAGHGLLFDSLAIRVDGPRSRDADVTVRRHLPDGGGPRTLRLKNGVLTHVRGAGPAAGEPDVEITPDEPALRSLLLGRADLGELVAGGRARVTGDPARLAGLTGHLTEPDPGFPIVTP